MTATPRITDTFFTPFLSGGAASADVPSLYQIAINSRGYIIDPKKYQRTTLQATRAPQDGSVEPGEQSLTSEGLWKRGQENWVLGAGQEFFDNRISQTGLFTRNGENASIRYRFWKSKGIDVFSSEGKLSLLHETEQKLASASTAIQLLTVGTRLYYCDGTTVRFTSDPTPVLASITWTTVSLGGNTPVAMATDGSTVWIACSGAGNVRSSVAGSNTSSAFSALANVTLLAYANGHLVAAVANQLYEILRDGTTSIFGNPSHNNPSWTWTSIIGAPNAIYAAGYAGHVGEVYSVTLDPTTFALNTPVYATGFPFGETPNVMFYDQGVVIVGTSRGVREAFINKSDNTLTYFPVITDPGSVKCIDAYGEFVHFGWSNLSAVPATDPTGTAVLSSGLGKMAVGRNTAEGIPAYSTDVQTPDGTSGTVLSVCNISGRRFFAVSGAGIYGENTNYVAEGWLQSGHIRFGTIESKVVAGGDWRHEPLPAGAAVGMLILKEDGTAISLARTSDTASLGTGTSTDASLPVGESFMVQMYVQRPTSATTNVTLRRWTVRALVTPQRMDEIILPIIMRTTVVNHAGQDIAYDPLAEFNFLKTLEATGQIVRYQEGTSSYRAYVDRVEVQPDKWTDGYAFFEGMLVVRLLTIPGGYG